eukprot:scaffold41057_cov33-Attheya_sp.AAC.1
MVFSVSFAVTEISFYYPWVIQFESTPTPAYNSRLMMTQSTLISYVRPECSMVPRQPLFKVQ